MPSFPLSGSPAGSRESGCQIPKSCHKNVYFVAFSNYVCLLPCGYYELTFILKNILRGMVKMHRTEKYWQMRVWLVTTDSTVGPKPDRGFITKCLGVKEKNNTTE